MKKDKITLLVVMVVVAVISFYGGTKYGSSQNSQNVSQGGRNFGAAQNISGTMRRGGQGGSGGFIGGQLISKNDKSITVQLRDGGSKIVFVSNSTQVLKSTVGSLTDLAVGEQVSVSGTANSDGSITAQSVQIRPEMPRPASQ